jgi:hypothetical protein
MTQTIDVPLGTLPPQERVDAWLADFAAALAARNIDRVVEQFAVDSFSRDLVAFTWNIKTVEGRDGIADMLTARLADADPSGFRTREAPTEEFDGDEVVTSAFIEFETAIGRGVGHLRLRGEQAWTLLTALQELKGHEERKGPKRVLGAVHGSEPDRGPGRRRSTTKNGHWATPNSPLLSSSAVARAALRWVRGCGSCKCRPSWWTVMRARRSVAQALQVAMPARPGLVRPPAIPAVPAELAGVLADGARATTSTWARRT